MFLLHTCTATFSKVSQKFFTTHRHPRRHEPRISDSPSTRLSKSTSMRERVLVRVQKTLDQPRRTRLRNLHRRSRGYSLIPYSLIAARGSARPSDRKFRRNFGLLPPAATFDKTFAKVWPTPRRDRLVSGRPVRYLIDVSRPPPRSLFTGKTCTVLRLPPCLGKTCTVLQVGCRLGKRQNTRYTPRGAS